MLYLETQDIVKQYGNYTALNGVSIKVPKGCIYGLLGPNGAGKSSLIRIINRITAPDAGKVLINERESTADDIFNIGYLPEERGLYKKMKVGEHIIFLARLRGLSVEEARQKTNYWLNKFGITSWENKKVEELSKGMQQKIQFIATVIHEPDLYILDEPFSGFDPVNAELLKNELLDLKAKGKTIILSTHNMESVETLCDEISLINKSQVVLQGNVKEIKAQYKQHIFKLNISGDNFDIESSHFSVLSQKLEKDSVEVRIRRNDDVSNSVLLSDVATKYEILSFEEELPSMNDIFIQIVSNPA
ncbi:ATP-binding cassette domain-containing protein [Dysgonomonas sp. Marseille-P4677]|uniref:ABC transporter ATP-binding protein n=1 Tax=Dysgonomonas sp. Marseille-P4677 TaxID=2364790 RepID=UPI0019126C79|nr:ATP-binding cassette domain-containing protein [Dysgonomonas sp. Marseille-P4677]MBK5722648.1 ATP-binding cassette domain-containing protein [Dysgonomonas sp. Marseille-P4677]